MPGAQATGRFAPAPISTDAMRLLAAVAVTRSRRTSSCARSKHPWPPRRSCLLASLWQPLAAQARSCLRSCHQRAKGPLTMQAA